MSLPGFAAEASIYRTSNHYRMSGAYAPRDDYASERSTKSNSVEIALLSTVDRLLIGIPSLNSIALPSNGVCSRCRPDPSGTCSEGGIQTCHRPPDFDTELECCTPSSPPIPPLPQINCASLCCPLGTTPICRCTGL
jgi:hypothetical protein